jgi:hypothetical protein
MHEGVAVDSRVSLPSRRRRFIARVHHCGPPRDPDHPSPEAGPPLRLR